MLTLTKALLDQSLYNVDENLSTLLISMMDFEMTPSRMVIHQAVIMGKPLSKTLMMANDCYDRQREVDIVKAIESLTTWKQLSPAE